MTKSDIILPINDKRNPTRNRAIRIGFLLVDGFALMSYASVVEAFRAANVLSGRALYEWKHISIREAFVSASNGARMRADAQISDTLALDLLLVCAAGNPALFRDKRTFARLRYLASRGMRIGGVSGGPYILARAGLLDLSVLEHQCFPLADVNRAISGLASRNGGFSNYVIVP